MVTEKRASDRIWIVIIPNAQEAVVEIGKLCDYTLNPEHRVGRHKARLFSALLGLTGDDADALRGILLEAVRTRDAEHGDRDAHGQRYRLDFVLTWRGRQAPIRSVWNVRPNETSPRLVTCYPLKEGDG
jgi:hypothetical protein